MALVVLAFLGGASAFPPSALAANAIRTPAHYNDTVIVAGDDTYTSVVNLPFTMNWNGTVYNQIYINMNGNCTFGNFSTAYDPITSMATTNRDMLAPFWADVDTRGTISSLMSNSSVVPGNVPQVNGRNAFIVNWINVGRYNQSGPLNSFQLVLIDRSDTGAGNFDIEYNYNTINWDRGTASSTYYARAGWSRTGNVGYELTGGNTSGSYLDTGANALVDGTLNAGGVLGRYVWSVRNGSPPNSPPLINLAFGTTTLESNGPAGYVGYSGAADAIATDPDGSIASLVRAPVAGTTLGFGSNPILWTATDNSGQVATATQSIVVADTIPPTLPALTSPSHALSTWSKVATVLLNWPDATDAGSGVSGYSFNWTANAAGLPDTMADSYAAGSTTVTTIESETFPTNTWPADWTKGGTDPTYLIANNAAGRTHGTSAAEIYTAANNTRRTAQFTKTFDLSGYTSATLSFWDYTVQLEAGDFNTVEYSTNGTTWTTLQTRATNAAWTQRTYAIPTGSPTVTIRFSGSVNATNEFVDWDDITLTGVTVVPNSASVAPGDGRWYFNLRATDVAGNWTPAAASLGPIWIDTTAPVSTSNAPSAWVSSTPVPVTILATDSAGSGVAYSRYKLDAAATATYTAAVAVSGEGTHTLLFWSSDALGNSESTKTATVRIDTVPPTTPTNPWAAAPTTSSIDVTCSPVTDVTSGVAYYAYFRNGSLVGTATGPSYTDTGLTPGQSYGYTVRAYDAAGNASAPSVTVTATCPPAGMWMSITQTAVTFAALTPGTPSTITSATTVSVGSVGNVAYDFTCAAADFSNLVTTSPTPTMPVSTLSFATHGYKTIPAQPFSASPVLIDSSTGQPYVWQHDYIFDFTMTPPWAIDPGTYQTGIVYTAVAK